MSDPCLFGWAATEVIKVIKLCDEFIKAYSNGPSGAAVVIEKLYATVKTFRAILENLKKELNEQDTKAYIDWDAISKTFIRCHGIFKKYGFVFKPTEQRGVFERLWGTSQYIWDGKDTVEEVNRALERDAKYVMMYLQLLTMKSNKIQAAHLETHGIQHEMILKKLGRIEEMLEHQERPATIHGRRANSIAEVPKVTDSSIVADPATYEEGQKASADLQDYLERVKQLEDQDLSDDERAVVHKIGEDLSQRQERIQNSIERNTNQGAQKALARIVSRRPVGKPARRRSSAESTDSGYDTIATVVTSDESSEAPRYRYGPSSRRSSDGFGSPRSASESLNERHNSIAEYCETILISSAEISFNTDKRSRYSFPCKLFQNVRDSCVQKIVPSPDLPIPENIALPVMEFVENESRPIPHIEWRGPSECSNTNERHPVIITGNSRLVPGVLSLEYVFGTYEESKAFQEIVFGKKLVLSLYTHKIKSKRGTECENGILRLWDDHSSNKPKSRSHSLFYYANGQTNQHHVEIDVYEIESLKNREGKKPLELIFKKEFSSGAKYKSLTIEFTPKHLPDVPSDRKEFIAKICALRSWQ